MSKFFKALWLALILIAMFTVPARSQEMNVSYKNATIEQVLADLKHKTDYTFVYQKMVINDCPNVTVQKKGIALFSLLNEVFKQSGLAYEVVDKTIVIRKDSKKIESGNVIKTITGTVTDKEGEPLIGVSIQQLGSSNGAVTDINGNYSIKVTGNTPVLRYSYLGMEGREVPVTNRLGKVINVKMDIAKNMLNDVYVTGYQTLSKERATGSFDKVSGDVLNSRPSSDLSNMLQGVVAGMQATEKEDGSVDFLIRGTSSLYANTHPLIVVDGFPIEGTFSSINPNDVESVTVLKDAAAASIWGARSANGVIVVTTKKGQKGRLKVDVQGFYRMNTRPDLDYILAQADSKTTVDYELMAIKNEWSLGDFSPSPDYLTSPMSLVHNYYYANKYYGMSESEMNSNFERLRNTDNRSQIKNNLMRTQALQQYNVSISGGTDKYSAYTSLMFEKNNEATIKRGYERYLINFSNSYNFNKYITATASATFQHKTQETSGPTISDFAELSPYENLLNEDGSYAENVRSWNSLIVKDLNLQNLPYNDMSYNMLREVRNRDYKTETTRYRFNVGLNAKIWRNIVFDTKFQYEKNVSEYKQFDNEETNYVRQMINYYTKYDLANDMLITQYIPSGGIIRRGKTSDDNYVWRNQLSYNETFGKHDVSAMAGFEMSQYKTSSVTYPYVLGYNEKSNTSQPSYYGTAVSASTIDGYPDYYGTIGGFVANGFSERKDKYFSYFANAAYMFNGKYGASFSIRADGSNFVSEDKSLRWSPMWSIGGKWNVYNESFMESTKSWLDRLTLRLTYGINGNAEKSTSPQTLLSTTANSTTGTNVSNISSYGNPMLRWEETNTTNLGVDFSLFKGALSGKVEYYNRLGKYIVGTVTVPSVYGSTVQKYNNAEILNRGIETELTGRANISSIGLGITSTVTFAYNYNKVQKLFYPALYCYQLIGGSFVEGKPVGAIYSYEFAGTKDGTPYVKTLDGSEWSFSDLTLHNRTLGLDKMTYSGTTISPYTFGWANQFSYKGFDLYIYFTGKFGGVFRAPTCNEVPLANSKSFISKYITRLMNSDGVSYPTLPAVGDYMCYRWDRYIPYLQNDIEDASFIRLKEVNLTYHIPDQILRKVRMHGAKVFVQARDLGLVFTSNKYGYDPEWLPGGYKPTTSITFGASLNF